MCDQTQRYQRPQAGLVDDRAALDLILAFLIFPPADPFAPIVVFESIQLPVRIDFITGASRQSSGRCAKAAINFIGISSSRISDWRRSNPRTTGKSAEEFAA
jgi:hypothetical protein